MSSASPSDPIQALAGALSTRFQLVSCADVATLLNRTSDDPAGFVTGCRIRVGEYYDIQPAITVYDAALGTLGFVEQISRSDPEANWLRSIERAAAVRQILIDAAEEKSRTGAGQLALQVELVLLVSGAGPNGGPDPLRAALTRIARETGYLRLTGLSILDADLHPDLPDAALRRAFAWLLKDTRKWFERDTFRRTDQSWRKNGEPLRLRLRDYRLAGVREFACDGTSWLNLVHGNNGSGKSSVSEALELLLTNHVQRLDEGGEKNYFTVVRHRVPEMQEAAIEKCSAAEVALLAGESSVRALVKIEPGRLTREGENPDGNVQANSFRIDQVFMDKLIRNPAAGRAALFLNAFSPGEAGRLSDLQTLRKEVSGNWKSLPEHVRKRAGAGTDATVGPEASRTLTDEAIADFVVRELGPLAGAIEGQAEQAASPNQPAAELSQTMLEALLPSDSSDMARLVQVHAPLGDSMQALLKVRDRAALTQAASQFQSNLTSLVASLPLQLADLKAAQLVFQEFQGWNATGRTSRGESFEADLRQWLELQALADLSARYGEIAATVQAAGASGWTPDSRDAFLLSMQTDAVARNRELVEQLNAARARVESWQQSQQEGATAAASDSGKVRRWLSAREVGALNRVGKYLMSAASPDLGVRFNRALAQDQEESLVDMAIGRKGGLDQAIRECAEIIGACERLQKSAAGAAGDADALQRITSLVKTARRFGEISKELPQNFFLKLAEDKQERMEMLAAFNELLALMTPARWAYRDIEITPDLASGDPALGLTTAGGARADLLLNTAELNAFAMVLFLLLAPRLPNALRILILDDPLQNMDELTVVTLARAMAKLQPPVYPKGWQILAFFHGAANVEVIRDEVPCVVYHLPWLQSPAGTAPLNQPVAEGDNRGASWQKLTPELVAPMGR